MAIKSNSRTVKHLTRNPLMQWQRLVDINIASMLSTDKCNVGKPVAYYSGKESLKNNRDLQNTHYHENGTHLEQPVAIPNENFTSSKIYDFINTSDGDDSHIDLVNTKILDVDFYETCRTSEVTTKVFEETEHKDNDMDEQSENLYYLKEWDQIRDPYGGNGSRSSMNFYDDIESLLLEEDEENSEELVVRDLYLNKDEFAKKLTRMCESSNNEETVSCNGTFAFADNFGNAISTTNLHCLTSERLADIASVECSKSECVGDDGCNMPDEVEQREMSPPYPRRSEWIQSCNCFDVPQYDENSPQPSLIFHNANFPGRYEGLNSSDRVEAFSSSHDDSSDFSGNEGDGSNYRDIPTRLLSGYDRVNVDLNIAFSQTQEYTLVEANHYRDGQSAFTHNTSLLQPAKPCPCPLCSVSEETRQVDNNYGGDADDLDIEVDNDKTESQHDIFPEKTAHTAMLEFEMIEMNNPNVSLILLNNDENIIVSPDSERKTIYEVPSSNKNENYLNMLSETIDNVPLPEMIGNFESSSPHEHSNQCNNNYIMCTTRHNKNSAENYSCKRKRREKVGDIHSPKNSLLKEKQKSQDLNMLNLFKTDHYACSSNTEQNDPLVNSTDDAKIAHDKKNAMQASVSFEIWKNGDKSDLTRNSNVAKSTYNNFESCSNIETGTGRSRVGENETYRTITLLSSPDTDETYRFKSNTDKAHDEKEYYYDEKIYNRDNKSHHSLFDKRQIFKKDTDNKIICETEIGHIFPVDDIQHESESGACDAENISDPGTIVEMRSLSHLATTSEELQTAKIDTVNEEFKLSPKSVENEAGQISQACTSKHTYNNFELNMDINNQHVSFDNPRQKVSHSEADIDRGSFLSKSFSSIDGNDHAVLDLEDFSVNDYRTTRTDTSLKILTENDTEAQVVGSGITDNCFINTWDQDIIMSGDTVFTELPDDIVYQEEALTTLNNPPWTCAKESLAQECVNELTIANDNYSDNAIEKKEASQRSQQDVSSVSYWTRFYKWLSSKFGNYSKKEQNTNMFGCSHVSKLQHLKSANQSEIYLKDLTLETSTTAFPVADQQALLQIAETRSTNKTNSDRPIAPCNSRFSPNPSSISSTCDTKDTYSWTLSPNVTDGTWQHTKRRGDKQLFKDANCQTDINYTITNGRGDSRHMRRQLHRIKKLIQKQKTNYPKQSKSLRCIKCSNHVKTKKTKGVSSIYLHKAAKPRKSELKRNFSLVRSGNDGSSVENIDCSLKLPQSQREMEETVYNIPDTGDGIVPTSLNCCDSETPGKAYTDYLHNDHFCEISLSSDECKSTNSLSIENKRVNTFDIQLIDAVTESNNRVLNRSFRERGPSSKPPKSTEIIVIPCEPLTFSTVETAVQPTYSDMIPIKMFSSVLVTEDSSAKGVARKYKKITLGGETVLTALTNKSDESLAEADVATRQCDTSNPDMQRLPEADILQFSLECLLEMLVQRGKILQAFVANTEGNILAKTAGLVITDEDSRKILGSLSSSYAGVVRLQFFNEIYTCLKHEDGASLVGRSQEAILVARRGQRSMVVGFADPSTPGSCIKEIQELSHVLGQRGL